MKEKLKAMVEKKPNGATRKAGFRVSGHYLLFGTAPEALKNRISVNPGTLTPFSIAKAAGDVASVAFVGFDFIAGLSLGFGWGHEDAIDLLLNQMSGDHKAGGAAS